MTLTHVVSLLSVSLMEIGGTTVKFVDVCVENTKESKESSAYNMC